MSLARPLARPLVRSLASPITYVTSGGGGSPAFSPTQLANLVQFYQPAAAPYYAASTLSGKQVLRSDETYGDFFVPRQGRAAKPDGTNDLITIGNISASATLLTFNVKLAVDNQKLFTLQNSTATAVSVVAGVLTFGGSLTVSSITVDGVSKNATEAGALLNDNGWHTVVLTLSSISVSDLRIGYDGTTYGNFSISKFGVNASDADGLWVFNEESGTTHYDSSGNANHGTITNADTALSGTYHVADTGVTENPANVVGHSTSGTVIIPRDESTPSNDVLGGALENTGPAPNPHTVSRPCLTGDGTALYAALGTHTIDRLKIYFYTPSDITAASSAKCLVGFGSGFNTFGLTGAVAGALIDETFTLWATGPFLATYITTEILAGWHEIEGEWDGTKYVLTLDGVLQTTFQGASGHCTKFTSLPVELFRYNASSTFANFRVANLEIESSGVTTYFPFEEGKDRNIGYVKSDNTYGIAASAVVNGDIATAWSNKTDAVQSWRVNEGGRMASGVFIPATPDGTICADGLTPTLVASKTLLDNSTVNANPFTKAENNGLGFETAYTGGTDRTDTATAETKFARVDTDGVDRLFATSEALTGTDLTNAEAYITP